MTLSRTIWWQCLPTTSPFMIAEQMADNRAASFCEPLDTGNDVKAVDNRSLSQRFVGNFLSVALHGAWLEPCSL